MVEQVESLGLRIAGTSLPDGAGQFLETAVGLHGVGEDVLKGLGPLDTVVQTLETPQVLQEMQHRGVGVGRGGVVAGTFVVDESVGRDPWGDEEGGHTDTETGEVVGDVVAI